MKTYTAMKWIADSDGRNVTNQRDIDLMVVRLGTLKNVQTVRTYRENCLPWHSAPDTTVIKVTGRGEAFRKALLAEGFRIH